MLSNSSLLNSLNQAQNAQLNAMKRIASGLRVSTAQDDAAGLAIAERMAGQLGGYTQAAGNVANGLSLTDTAGGALGQVSESLQRMRELAVQAANSSNSASDRQAIQGEINQLAQGIDQIAGTTQFNGQNLLDGSFTGQIQVGPNGGDTQALSLASASSTSLGVAALDVSNPTNAAAALNSLDNAINSVGAQQGVIGAAQAALNANSDNLSNTYANLAGAKSGISDTNYVDEAVTLMQAKIQAQVSIKALAMYNDVQNNVLGLFKA